MKILVTGARGMIGSALCDALAQAGHHVVGVDRQSVSQCIPNVEHVQMELGDTDRLKALLATYQIERVIHLAALAHTVNEDDLSWERYHHVNVKCAESVFRAAAGLPVLFISTVDVYGFAKEPVDGTTPLKPVTHYGKSKAMAEEACKKLCDMFSIYRLSPVYTLEIKRDIQKRYYIKCPYIAYKIGKGSEYEVLNITGAIEEIVAWCGREPLNEVKVIKDEQRLKTVDAILEEKQAGRAPLVLWLPQWLVRMGYVVLKGILGENKYTYLLHKAVYPLRSK